MIGSIERLRRQLPARLAAPMLLVVIGAPTRPDPINKRIGGTAGVIAIPGVSASAPSTPTRGDAAPVEARRDSRAERGRVLYAPGHAPRDTAQARPAHKPCPETRVVSLRGGNTAPTS